LDLKNLLYTHHGTFNPLGKDDLFDVAVTPYPNPVEFYTTDPVNAGRLVLIASRNLPGLP